MHAQLILHAFDTTTCIRSCITTHRECAQAAIMLLEQVSTGSGSSNKERICAPPCTPRTLCPVSHSSCCGSWAPSLHSAMYASSPTSRNTWVCSIDSGWDHQCLEMQLQGTRIAHVFESLGASLKKVQEVTVLSSTSQQPIFLKLGWILQKQHTLQTPCLPAAHMMT